MTTASSGDHTEAISAEPQRQVGSPPATQRGNSILPDCPRYGIVTLDEEGTVCSSDPGAARLFGYPEDEMIGLPWKTLAPELPWKQCMATRGAETAATAHGSVTRERIGARDQCGESFDIDLALREIRVGERRLYAAIVRESRHRPAQTAVECDDTDASPEAETSEEVNESAFGGPCEEPARVTVNLASPNALEEVRSLINGHGFLQSPGLAYALPPGAPVGFWIGKAEFVAWPERRGSLYEALRRAAPGLKRVMALSEDLDAMTELQSQLGEQRISTAVVLGGRQARDLLPSVRPEAVLVHLSPRFGDGFRALAAVRGTTVGTDLPVVFLVDGESDPRERSFLRDGANWLCTRGSLRASHLPDAIAEALQDVPSARSRAA